MHRIFVAVLAVLLVGLVASAAPAQCFVHPGCPYVAPPVCVVPAPMYVAPPPVYGVLPPAVYVPRYHYHGGPCFGFGYYGRGHFTFGFNYRR